VKKLKKRDKNFIFAIANLGKVRYNTVNNMKGIYTNGSQT
jgi:hypothetical protein